MASTVICVPVSDRWHYESHLVSAMASYVNVWGLFPEHATLILIRLANSQINLSLDTIRFSILPISPQILRPINNSD